MQRENTSRLVCEIADLLDELSDVESDSPCSDVIRDDRVGNLIHTLSGQLGRQFACEERSIDAKSLPSNDFADRSGRLHQEHDRLLGHLNDLLALTESPSPPDSTWTDIESRFHRFAVSLADHNLREEVMSKQHCWLTTRSREDCQS